MDFILEGVQKLQEQSRLMAQPSVTQWNSEDHAVEGADWEGAELSGRMRICS